MDYKWNTYKIYESDEAWNLGKQELEDNIKVFESTYLSMINSLEDFLRVTKLHILINELIERVYCYPRRFLDLDIKDKNHKEMFDEALDIYSRILKLTSNYQDYVLENKRKIEGFLETKDASFFRRYYEIIFNRKDAKDSGKYFKIYQGIRNEYQELISNLDYKKLTIDGEYILVNEENYSNLLLNDDRNVRKLSFELLNETYLEQADLIADLYIRKLKNDIVSSRNKGYKTLKEMKLVELELPVSLIDNTIEEVNKNLDIMNNYVSLKKELNGYQQYFLYDSSYPKSGGGKKVSFDDALSIAESCLAFFGENYIDKINSLKDGSIDAYPKEGKRTMNFTGITYAGIPYMCLNYNEKLSGVRSLIHEIGHAVHLLYTKEKNDFTYFEFSLFLTEIVAKVNEVIFNNYVTDEDGETDIKNILSVQLNSIFNQIMFTEFEDKIVTMIENDEEVNANIISEIYEDLLYKYNGESLGKHEYNKYGWLRIGHFVMQEPFYLYQYSIGTMLANAIYTKLVDDNNYKEKYLEFLSIGNKLNIIDSLKSIDIDLFNERMLDESFNYLNDMITKLRKVI